MRWSYIMVQVWRCCSLPPPSLLLHHPRAAARVSPVQVGWSLQFRANVPDHDFTSVQPRAAAELGQEARTSVGRITLHWWVVKSVILLARLLGARTDRLSLSGSSQGPGRNEIQLAMRSMSINCRHLILVQPSTIKSSDYGRELYTDKCSTCIRCFISHQHNANDSMKDKASKPLWTTPSKFHRSGTKSASNPLSLHRRVRTCGGHQIKSVDRFERTLDTGQLLMGTRIALNLASHQIRSLHLQLWEARKCR